MNTPRRTLLLATPSIALLPVLTACGPGDADGSSASDAGASDAGGQEPPSNVDLPEGWTWVAGSDSLTVTADPQLPVTVTDGTGTETEVRDIEKIIVGGEDVADVLAAMGLADKIFAAPENSVAEAAKNAPEQYAFNQNTGVEGLLSIEGTLFIGNNTDRHGDIAKKFRGADVDAVVLDDQASIPDKVRALGEYIGDKDAGEELATAMEDQLAEAATAAADVDIEELKVLIVTASGAGGANAVVGSGTAASDMTDAIGVVNVGVEAGLRQYSVDYSDEALLDEAPDVIVTGTGDLEAWQGAEGFLEAFPTLAQTPAGQNSSLFLMPSEEIKVGATGVGSGALALGQALASLTAGQ